MRVIATGFDSTESDTLYIPDKIDDLPVVGVGYTPLMGRSTAKIYRFENVYFPWSIEFSPVGNIEYSDNVKYIISASTNTLIDFENYHYITYVIPNCMYADPVSFYNVRNLHTKIDIREESNIMSANIAYLFNYEDNPNKGYFFVDLLEESGKLTKPPYNPKRGGYKFAGWYKEAECLNVWDFENDIVKISFDEEGNRIYEEICLYAKWVKK